MRKRPLSALVFVLVFLVGGILGYYAGATSTLKSISAPRPRTVRPSVRPGVVPTYRLASPRRYWEGWVRGNMREVCEKDGMVFYIYLYKDNWIFWKTPKWEIEGFRDAVLKYYLEEIANSSDFEKKLFTCAAHLTGKQNLSVSEWREWWKANGPDFVFTPKVLTNYETWLATQSEYRRWRHDWVEGSIARERQRIKGS